VGVSAYGPSFEAVWALSFVGEVQWDGVDLLSLLASRYAGKVEIG
jgi:hypothetical protein